METTSLTISLLAIVAASSASAATVSRNFVQNRTTQWTQQSGVSASQSTTASGGVASRAIDGNTNGVWSGGSVTHTDAADTNSYWQVDLGEARLIEDINLFNRTDCCGGRLSNYSVLASNDATFTGPHIYDSGNQATAVGTSLNFSGLGATARYVRIQRDGLSTTNESVLSLAEVQVTGAASFTFDNLALASTANQSSTLSNPNNPTADKAIDGNLAKPFGSATTTHTLANNGGDPVFWETTLAADTQINEIALFNRGDGNQDRLSNFRLSVFDGTTEVWGQNYFEGTGQAQDIFSIQEDTGGFFATGDRVRVELIGGVNNSGGGTNQVLSLREVEIYGVAVPEPSSTSLLGLAGLALILRRRRS